MRKKIVIALFLALASGVMLFGCKNENAEKAGLNRDFPEVSDMENELYIAACRREI